MGKIRVQDLARRMGISEQDLLFKLKSIGVRVDEKSQIDSNVIQAILEGKQLPQPREVILRDEEAKASAPITARRRPPQRRLPVNPLRPTRRRTIIQKVEPRIKTIPVTERPAPPAPSPEVPEKVAATEAAKTELREAARRSVAREVEREAREAKARPPERRAGARAERDLRALRGPVEDVEQVEEAEEEERPISGRRRRRAQRKKKEVEDGGRLLAFKRVAPEGPITVTEGMTVRQFADKLGVKSKDLIRVLFERGVMATINHVLDADLAKEVSEALGVEAQIVSFEEEVQIEQAREIGGEEVGERISRAPVVTIMGHVDHGKTTLLDTIRSSKITAGEFGGITQHIGAYQVDANGRKIVFLDTPGHEAFTMMRARGAKVTDIVVLVVAADDGVMPQTAEAIDHARAAGVPIVVAINKIDKPDANPDRVKKELADRQLTVEDWGGDTVSAEISALRGKGIPELMELILLSADLLEMTASPELPGQGVVLEARKEPGRGIVATVLVQDGTLRNGNSFVAGATWGRIRSMESDLGERLEEAGPSTPVEVSGFSELPEAGDLFQVVEEENKARSIANFRRTEQRQHELAPTVARASLEQLFDQIKEGEVKELPIVLKADVQGSVEVLSDTLQKLSTDAVKLRVLHSGVGAITTNDVILASASGAVVVGFNVRPERKASDLAEQEQVDIRLHTVIYELSDEIRRAMTGLLEPTFREVAKGRAEVRETFSVPKLGTVAGCHVVDGVIPRSAEVRLLRDNVVVYEGKIASLRRFKDDVAEVRSGFDCGIRLDRYQDVKPGDTIEAFVQEEESPSL